MALSSAYARLTRAVDKLAAHIDKKVKAREPNREQKDRDAQLIAAENAAVVAITPRIRAFMAGNLRAYGVKADGLLGRTITNCNVWMFRKGNRKKLMIGFQAGISEKSNGSSPYVYGSALNYGAVIGSKGLGAKAKRSLKRGVLEKQLKPGAKVTDRQRIINLQAQWAGTKTVRIGGGAAIIKPRNFFKLTPSQAQTIAQLFAQLVAQNMGHGRIAAKAA